MLSKSRVAQALEKERDRLLQSAAAADRSLALYLDAFDTLSTISTEDLRDRLGGVPWPGGRPTDDMTQVGAVARFPHQWQSAQEARAWALQRLRGVPTAAVDGSQIAASKEFGSPVSLVQIGWFQNPHDGEKPYVKDVRNVLLIPEEGDTDGAEYASADSRVNRCRFTGELETVGQQIEALAGTEPTPVIFFDGTFVLSFAGRIPAAARAGYLQALFRVLDLSRTRRVPVIGYVDLSYATDMVTMIRTAFDLPTATIFDSQLLARRMEPLDRTAACIVARGDILPLYRTDEHDYAGDLAFLYLQTGHRRPPARLDIPLWVVEEGLLEHVVDIVRAEVVVGGGYPYALETADVTALLSAEDRMAFYRMFEDFARDAGLQTLVPNKTASKVRRR